MSAPFTLGDTLRIHDKAVYDWLNGLTVDYGSIAGVTRNAFPILRVFASPDRSFASIEDLLVRTGWIDGNTSQEMRQNAEENWAVLPLPICTIERDLPVNADNRNNVAGQIQRVYYDPIAKVYNIYPWPGMYVINYHITFWSLKRYTQAFITEWVMSQLGKLGAGFSEIMLYPQHPDPFSDSGPQALKYLGSQDLSQLEGHDPRWMRWQFDFSLNALMFRPALYTAPLARNIDTTGGGPGFISIADPSLISDTDPNASTPVTGPATTQSRNLFFDITGNVPQKVATDWPVIGNGVVTRAARYPGAIMGSVPPLYPMPFGLHCVVKDPTDAVDVLEAASSLDDAERNVVLVSFRYSTDKVTIPASPSFAVTVQSRDAPNNTLSSARAVTLPQSRQWTRVNMFALADLHTFLVQIAGIGSDAPEGVVITDILIRVVYTGTRIPFQQRLIDSPVSGTTSYRWASLENRPYLVVGVLGPGATAGTVYVDDDIQTPGHTTTQAVAANQLGFVILIHPKAGTIQVRAPSAMALAALYVQRYSGSDDENLI